MSKQRIETIKAPHIHLECNGSLRVNSWSESAVVLRGDNQVKGGQEGEEQALRDELFIQSSGDLVMTVPEAASIEISAVQGDAILKNLSGSLNILEVNGDTVLKNVENVSLNTIHGDFSGHNLSGSFAINEIMGDASIRNVSQVTVNAVYGDFAVKNTEGDVDIQSVMGDLSIRNIHGTVTLVQGHRDVNLRNISGLVNVSNVNGDVRLTGGLAPGKHHVKADGDIVLRWPANAPLNVEASAKNIRNRLALKDVVEEEGHLSGRIGDGDTFLILEANGRIILKDVQPTNEWDDFDGSEFEFDFDFSGIGEKIAGEIGSRMEELSSRLERNFGPDFTARIEEQTLKAAAQAEKAAAEAIRQVEKTARQVRWQSDHPMWKPATQATPGKSKDKQATEAEQLKILKMVETGKITPEEASILLEAIEG